MRGAAFDFASSPWKSPPGRSPDADLPYEFRLPPGTFGVLEYYDDLVRGGVLSGVPVADGADDSGDDDGPGACDDDEHFVGKGSGRGRQTRAPSPAFDDSDVLTESDFNLFDANQHLAGRALSAPLRRGRPAWLPPAFERRKNSWPLAVFHP